MEKASSPKTRRALLNAIPRMWVRGDSKWSWDWVQRMKETVFCSAEWFVAQTSLEADLKCEDSYITSEVPLPTACALGASLPPVALLTELFLSKHDEGSTVLWHVA